MIHVLALSLTWNVVADYRMWVIQFHICFKWTDVVLAGPFFAPKAKASVMLAALRAPVKAGSDQTNNYSN
jgi:hypothetical protein